MKPDNPPPVEGDNFSLPLSFSKVRCRCGTMKALASSCRVCGASSRRVDPSVKRRRRQVQPVVRALSLAVNAVAPISSDSVWGSLSTMQGDLIDSLQTFASKGHSGVKPLENAVKRLVHFKYSLAKTPRLRPSVEMWRTVDRIVEKEFELVETYLQVLTASNPEEATAMGERGQMVLDELASIAAELCKRLSRFDSIIQAPIEVEGSAILALSKATVEKTGAKDILELARRGSEDFRRVLQHKGIPDWIGAGLQMTVVQVEYLLDSTRFWEVLRIVFHAMMSRDTSFKQLIQNPNWLETYRTISREMYQIGLDAQAMSLVPMQRSNLVRGLINRGGEIVEPVAKTLLAMFLAVVREDDFERVLQKEDVGRLLKWARDDGFDELLFGVDLAIRDARAHGLYSDEPGEKRIKFTCRRREDIESLSDDELVDHVLGGLESVLAIHGGITVAAATLGYEIEKLDSFEALEFQPETLIKIALSLNGWMNVDVAQREKKITITGTDFLEERTPDFPKLTSTLLPYIPDCIEEVELVLHSELSSQHVTAQIEPFRRWNQAVNEDEKMLFFVEALSLLRVGENPSLPESQRRKWAAMITAQRLEEGRSQDLAFVRKIVKMAERVADYELSTAVAQVSVAQENAKNGKPVSPRGRAAINSFCSWIERQD